MNTVDVTVEHDKTMIGRFLLIAVDPVNETTFPVTATVRVSIVMSYVPLGATKQKIAVLIAIWYNMVIL